MQRLESKLKLKSIDSVKKGKNCKSIFDRINTGGLKKISLNSSRNWFLVQVPKLVASPSLVKM